ncbi:MAG: hypothetical protein AMXMBFR48_27860 [Ignavibacteriales bacterium]
MDIQKQLYILLLITLFLLSAEYMGVNGLSSMTKLPWSGDIYKDEAGWAPLMPVLLYCILLPVMFAVSLRGLMRMIHENGSIKKYLRSVNTMVMAVCIYIIVLFVWQSAGAAATLAEHEVQKENLKSSLERDMLLLELNEVCFLAREKMLLPASFSGIGKKPAEYIGKEPELLREILADAQFSVLDKISISALSDSSVTLKVYSRGEKFSFEAQVFTSNRQTIYEELPVSGEVK